MERHEMTTLLTTPARRRALLTELTHAEVTYPERGATAGTLPVDAAQLRVARLIGRGEAVFARAAAAILGFEMHRRAGLDVVSSTPTAEVGTVVLVTFVRGLPIGVSAPCRILEVRATGDRRGFTYGTLPGHPESGEERFEVVRLPGGDVRLELTAFSRHTPGPFARLGPLTALGQRVVTNRYVGAVRRAAAGR
jgi:uncharacterized protein (UPF0548 family)